MGRPESQRPAGLGSDFEEFEAVAPGVLGMEAAGIRQIVVLDDGNTVGEESFPQFIKIGRGERGVSLAGRTKIGFYAYVQLLPATLEPAATPGAQCGRFLQFLHAEYCAIEIPSSSLASWGRCNQHVIDGRDAETHLLRISRRKSLNLRGEGGARRSCLPTGPSVYCRGPHNHLLFIYLAYGGLRWI
jgi:hypothetical protein